MKRSLSMPHQNKPTRNQSDYSSSGFSLVEILLSLGIFAIGIIAISSLFPAAAILQRETTQEVIVQMAAESAAAVINTQNLTFESGGFVGSSDLVDYYNNANTVFPADTVPLLRLTGSTTTPTTIQQRFNPSNRSYPSGLVNGTDTTNCDLHWIPFVQDLNGDENNPSWVTRLFIVEADSRAIYTQFNANDANPDDPITIPKVRSISITGIGTTAASNDTFELAGATDLEPSDIVMDSNGNEHTILTVNGNNITVLNPILLAPLPPDVLWYTPRMGGTLSPAQRVVTVDLEVASP